MEYIIIPLVALLASGLTLFSGFGLGTLLLPVFSIFYPIEIAIALTAVVHFLNNIFKLILFAKFSDKNSILLFGLPAILGAFLGAELLSLLSGIKPLTQYRFYDSVYNIEIVKLIISVLIFVFVMAEFSKRFEKLSFNKKYLTMGGILSGFFGGLSGHQGALRSAFLVKLNLSKESFIGTGVVIACLIDLTRLSVYSSKIFQTELKQNMTLLVISVLAAFAGAYIGNKILKKITYQSVKIIVAVMLIIISIGLASGMI
ncbi:MAG: sulfite exporter TauE/SafE family protein [Ignavibacteriales bacterium]|nr:MAG: sulfite exporter TauE/SafE family protein [Ignavibacteriales bacterium]